MTFEQIVSEIRMRKFRPIYLFMGDEPYYMDELTNQLMNTVLPKEERDFNQTVLYGRDTDVRSIIAVARNFPMMSEHQLVVVKEAQDLTKIEELALYAEKPLDSTVLVINYKGGAVKAKDLIAHASKNGVVFESKKIPDYKMPAYISSFVKSKGLSIDQKSAQMLSDYLGNDLSKLTNEVQKLIIALPRDEKQITDEVIEQNIGISKDYNNFELLKAVINRDVFKANQIANYFESNPKNNPLVVTLIVLFNFFSNLMICYWVSQKTEQNLANAIGLKNTYQAKDYMIAVKNYNAFKCMEIISLLRTYDAKGKGVDNTSTSQGELLKELLFVMMH